jgi:hypothetical protein
MRRRLSLSGGQLGHSSHAPAPQSRVLIAVAPAIDCSLDKAAFSAQAGVELCQRPPNCVALGLVMQTIALVLVLSAARARVHAVLGPEVCRQFINVDRFNIAPNSVLHLHAITRIFESDPLHTALILPNDQRSCGRNRARCSIGVDVGTTRRDCVHVGGPDRRALSRSLRRSKS